MSALTAKIKRLLDAVIDEDFYTFGEDDEDLIDRRRTEGDL